HRCARLQAFHVPQRASINAWKPLHTYHHVCQDIENKPYTEKDHLSWDRERPCRNAPHTAVTRPLSHIWPTTKLRPRAATWPARKAGSPRGAVATIPPRPPGLRHEPHDPRAPQRTPRHTSNRPSCPCTRRYATTAQVAPPPSYRRWSSK